MDFAPTRAAALARLARFLPAAGRHYAETRNADDGPRAEGRGNVSQLSPWLHGGLIGEREVLEAVLGQHSPRAAEKFIAEVFWRIYFKGYLEQRPAIWDDYRAGRDAALAALERNAGLRTAYAQATEGRTGIAAFDVWAKELVETGYLHNHARMWFASIWIFTLKLDWRLGADFFLRHLMDGDAASNTLSWRWVAGLHTKGKHYLAREDNIARYTAGRPEGALTAVGLAGNAEPLSEAQDYPRQKLNLPAPVTADDLARPFALLLHDEATHHLPLALPAVPSLVIGAARPEARSPGAVGEPAPRFARGAVASGMAEVSAAFGCRAVEWRAGEPLAPLLAQAGVERIALAYLPAGWTRDALMPDLAPLMAEGRVVTLLGDLARATWPHAKAGFFGVAKQIDALLGECGIAGG
ncbi:FAD-binding domain-containing protein [Porphyrobacter sp. LM 6]|uniref:FAD-binding domain-containing protein n=1 Tax=Porphyrobacter sp. LM 6 TaxID=1896196 RepID=UPI000847C283|nr:FAD-binding domain-containing protein [Porphyrobacter sp. LM 6]AOL93887.1 FAD binding domain of DNA photolyase [Porphyrobacter sp. LM 6]